MFFPFQPSAQRHRSLWSFLSTTALVAAFAFPTSAQLTFRSSAALTRTSPQVVTRTTVHSTVQTPTRSTAQPVNSTSNPNASHTAPSRLTLADVEAFAPIVRIHPNERYYPMDPLEFIRISRFRHYRSWQSDQGYNRYTRRWVTTNSHDSRYYSPPLQVLNAYEAHPYGKNRRPRDPNKGSWFNVFLEPDGNPRGERRPNGRVPVFYFPRQEGDYDLIQYWWFSGYNSTPLGLFNHQGDWEHVTVRVYQKRIVGVWFASHNSGNFVPRGSLRFVGTHPVVYMAIGTHASYPGPGRSGLDFTAAGYGWRTYRRLEPLSTQPWREYAGAWGEVGTNRHTTGPLGPWHKRNGK